MTLSIEQAREIVNFQISYDRTYTGKDLELFDKAMDPPTRAYAQGMVEGWDAAMKERHKIIGEHFVCDGCGKRNVVLKYESLSPPSDTNEVSKSKEEKKS